MTFFSPNLIWSHDRGNPWIVWGPFMLTRALRNRELTCLDELTLRFQKFLLANVPSTYPHPPFLLSPSVLDTRHPVFSLLPFNFVSLAFRDLDCTAWLHLNSAASTIPHSELGLAGGRMPLFPPNRCKSKWNNTSGNFWHDYGDSLSKFLPLFQVINFSRKETYNDKSGTGSACEKPKNFQEKLDPTPASILSRNHWKQLLLPYGYAILNSEKWARQSSELQKCPITLWKKMQNKILHWNGSHFTNKMAILLFTEFLTLAFLLKTHQSEK